MISDLIQTNTGSNCKNLVVEVNIGNRVAYDAATTIMMMQMASPTPVATYERILDLFPFSLAVLQFPLRAASRDSSDEHNNVFVTKAKH